MRPWRPLALCALLLSACSHGCAIGRSLWSPAPLPEQAQHKTAKTADGWELSLIHYVPAAKQERRRPVLFVHGIVTNQRNLDYDEKHSIVREAARHGLDAWSMSLRAHGESTKASLFGGDKKYDWDFDTYCTEDLPAAIAEVKEETGAAQIDLVGHSMGGMLVYCLLARGGEAAQSIGAAATLGSPLGFRWGPRMNSLARLGASAASKLPVVKLDSPTLLALPLMSLFPQPAALFLYNPANMDEKVWQGFLAVGVEDESPRLAAQFGQWLETDRFTSRDGALDYEKALAQTRTPVLVIAGKADQLGFTPLVRRGYDALGGDKAFVLVGEENGAGADYGHMDLLLGDHAPQEVFEPLWEWLSAKGRSGTAPTPAPAAPSVK
ncbi:MAG: alpha/beta hydrolase [Deltaproteobacteria bacterium]|nr:alpha/beta hydrolase [Deltaproteobacteria bacterium]